MNCLPSETFLHSKCLEKSGHAVRIWAAFSCTCAWASCPFFDSDLGYLSLGLANYHISQRFVFPVYSNDCWAPKVSSYLEHQSHRFSQSSRPKLDALH